MNLVDALLFFFHMKIYQEIDISDNMNVISENKFQDNFVCLGFMAYQPFKVV